MPQARRPFFGANWKMHKSPVEARAFAKRFREEHPPSDHGTVVFFPPSISLPALRDALGEREDLQIGVQDVHQEDEGAHTGAISASMAADAGAVWGLAGHSERRREFGDDDERVAAKVRRLLSVGIRPVLCVGETLEEREAGRLTEILERQMKAVLDGLREEGREALVYAYEPVWAIGTGRTAAPEDAAEAHEIVRRQVETWAGPALAREAVIMYGGSVKPHNAEELLSTPGIDGALVGSASLEPRDFAAICRVGAPSGSAT